MTQAMEELAAAYPELLTMRSLGKSVGGGSSSPHLSFFRSNLNNFTSLERIPPRGPGRIQSDSVRAEEFAEATASIQQAITRHAPATRAGAWQGVLGVYAPSMAVHK